MKYLPPIAGLLTMGLICYAANYLNNKDKEIINLNLQIEYLKTEMLKQKTKCLEERNKHWAEDINSLNSYNQIYDTAILGLKDCTNQLEKVGKESEKIITHFGEPK